MDPWCAANPSGAEWETVTDLSWFGCSLISIYGLWQNVMNAVSC